MLRIVPWITDGATNFLDTFFENKKQATVFEFGCGNSTLYFLSKGCAVYSVEHDLDWAQKITYTAKLFGLEGKLKLECRSRPYCDAFASGAWDIISIDGRDRVSCLQAVLSKGIESDTILLLDNTERVNGGRYQEYNKLLTGFTKIHFEQKLIGKTQMETGAFPDRAGWVAPHRWITTVALKECGGEFTTSGVKF